MIPTTKHERRQTRLADLVLVGAAMIALASLLTGCVTVPEADLIRARIAQKAYDDIKQSASEVEALGDKQDARDRGRTYSAIIGAYKLDMRESVEAGDTDRALETVDKRDQKLAQMESLSASKRGKYRAVASKLRVGAEAVTAVDAIAQKQSEATAKAWEGFLKEDLPAAAGELASSYATAKAAADTAANATPTTDPGTPAGPDTTDLADGGKK